MRTKYIVLIMVALLVVPAVADAQNWILRVRGIMIDPDDSSGEIGATGSTIDVDSATTIEVDITYMLSPSFGLELIAATAKHDLTAVGGALAGADLGAVTHLPPTLTAQWYIIPEGFINLYIGAGINFTTFYDYDLSGDLAALDVTDIEFDDSFGLAGNAGINFNLGKSFMINADVKYIQIDTEADIKVGSDTLDKVAVDINPWVFGLGVGFRF
jgi:outer membrane protein